MEADMARRIAHRQVSETPSRRQLLSSKESPSGSSSLAEVAGGTAAECAAVCCCGPFTLVNILVGTVVKLPVGLYRKALKKKRQNRRIGLLQPRRYDDAEFSVHAVSAGMWPEKSPSREVSDMEKEMCAKFNGTGFWRNPSEREQ